MKQTYKPFLTTALALAAVPAMAQAEGEEESTEKVNLAFRQVAAEDVVSNTSTVNVAELMKKNNITYALDNMQGYVGGWNGNGMWGYTDHLVLIDGVPRDVTNVKPDEIETITFMKGANAVILYGSRAAKGAILIKTKRGTQEGLNINVKANTGFHVAKSYPEYLGSAEYMTLYNEACANNGASPMYTDKQIYYTAQGNNPALYPDVNFYSSDFIKKAYNRSDVMAEINGGNDLAKFYSNVSYYRVGDYLNFGEAENNATDRLDVRGNVDIKLGDYIKAYVNAAATYYRSKSAVGANYWEQATTFRPNLFSPLIPISAVDPAAKNALAVLGTSRNIIDGKYFLGAGNVDAEYTNVFADYYAGGKKEFISRQFQFDAGVDIDLRAVLQGLSFHTQMSVDYQTSYNTQYTDSYATFTPEWSSANGQMAIIGVQKHNKDEHNGVQNISGSTSNQTVAFNAHFDYNRTFAEDHNVSAMLLANGFLQTKSGEYHRTANANMGLNLDYNYQHKYYANAAIATPWSTRLPKDERLGVSQSYTAGWNITNEEWFDQNIFNNLKLTASYSDIKTDLGIDKYYMYLGNYTSTGWWDWGGTGVSATACTNGGNNALTYITRKEFTVGLQGALLDNSLNFAANYFRSELNGQIIDGNNQAPSYFKSWYPEGQFYSSINFNNDLRTGFDFSANYKKTFGEVEFMAGANVTFYNTEATRRDDTQVKAENAYQKAQGKNLDAVWGYKCLGFFKDEDDLKNSPDQSSLGHTARVGDLKYADINKDGKIDNFDRVDLGKGGWYGNPLTLGVNLTAKYKGVTLFVLATGGFGGHGMKNNSYWQCGQNQNKYSAAVRDRAIIGINDAGQKYVKNLGSAAYPALSNTSAAGNFVDSDFWMYKTDRMNLSKVQLTYDFKSELFENNNVVRGITVYVSGSDLLTISKEREILEMNVGSAPQSRFYNLGVKVQF
ncbi:MAG: SusC/RagA family TonB-linked outer membrane protein [Bacteroidales bacterium]|nr:SusC/RagA family TonB-linked outer membrane protein [Bacteroidales bacterium]